MDKLNLTQQKHTFTNQKKCTTQNKHKKLKPGIVASYDIQSTTVYTIAKNRQRLEKAYSGFDTS